MQRVPGIRLLLLTIAILCSAATAAIARCEWAIVPSQNGMNDTVLYGVSATAENDVWAVGDANGSSQTFAEHWDGAVWSSVQIPTFGDGRLPSVSARDPSDAWAIGFGEGQTGVGVALHWNGTTWTSYQTPSRRNEAGVLEGVVTLSRSNAWAVGFAQHAQRIVTLALHWDGRRWSIVPTANAGREDELAGVAASGPNDVWAVGTSLRDSGLKARAVIQHWDGRAWSLVTVPRRGDSNSLNAVAVTSPSDAWAVGFSNNPGEGVRTLTLHWNGAAWSVVPSPNGGTSDELFGVAASRRTAWAVGFSSASGPLAMRWNGSRWQIVPTPPVYSGVLNAVSAVPGTTDFWAVGTQGPGSTALTEQLRCT